MNHNDAVNAARNAAKALLKDFDTRDALCARLDAVDAVQCSLYVMRAALEVVQCAVSFDASAIRAAMLVSAKCNVHSFTAKQIQSLTLRAVTDSDNAAQYVIKACVMLNLMTYDKSSKVATFNIECELYKALYESAMYYLEDETLHIDKYHVSSVMKVAKELKLIS
jgi:hypothetical protein